MQRPGPAQKKPDLTPSQLEQMRISAEAAAEITAAMVRVTNEKNPAKIGEAFKTIYKGIHEVLRG